MDEKNLASDKHLLRAILELIAKCKTLEELRESVARILKEEEQKKSSRHEIETFTVSTYGLTRVNHPTLVNQPMYQDYTTLK